MAKPGPKRLRPRRTRWALLLPPSIAAQLTEQGAMGFDYLRRIARADEERWNWRALRDDLAKDPDRPPDRLSLEEIGDDAERLRDYIYGFGYRSGIGVSPSTMRRRIECAQRELFGSADLSDSAKYHRIKHRPDLIASLRVCRQRGCGRTLSPERHGNAAYCPNHATAKARKRRQRKKAAEAARLIRATRE